MGFLKRWSSFIGVLALLCALPRVADIVERYRTSGTLHYPAASQLPIVPVIYLITRYAERRMG
jgi:hypothetical protein